MNEIYWPENFLPGTTDNFASNERIVQGLTTTDVWPYIDNTSEWPKYYKNASDIYFYSDDGPKLGMGKRFRFVTFGLTIEAEVKEYVPPCKGQPARLAWNGWRDGTADEFLDVYHAWLFENLPGNRVRILTQESQIGQPAKDMAVQKPNPMINAHQDWIDGIIKSAKTF